MPWTYDKPPAVALNWTESERRRCVDAANAVLERGGSDEDAIFACIAAAGKGELMENTKVYRSRMELKTAEGLHGEFQAVFATLNVIDLDGDVTEPGAFGEQRVLIEPWNHNYAEPPVGKGTIREVDDEAVITGKFFLDTESGRHHYTVVKELEDQQEWSYTFRVIEAEAGVFEGQPVRLLKRMDVVGVSPVTRGAGINTRTTAIKGARDGALDGPANDSGAGPAARPGARAGDGGGAGADGGEGEAGADAGKPSGHSPRDLELEIEILKMSVPVGAHQEA